MNILQKAAQRILGVETRSFLSGALSQFVSKGGDLSVPVVSPSTADCINVIQACVTLIVETKTLVRPKIVRHTKKGKEIVTDYDQYQLLNRKANKLQNSINWEKEWVASYLYEGNGYAEMIIGGNGRPVEYVNLKSSEVKPFLSPDGEKFYKVKGRETPIPSERMLHLADLSRGELEAKSRITRNATSIENALLVDAYSREIFKNGPAMSGYIYGDNAIDAKAAELLRTKFHEKSRTAGETGILPFGFKYQPLSFNLSFADANAIEANKWGAEQMARIYRVPLTLIGRGESADNKGESEWNFFLTTCMAPLCLLMQAELDSKIFRTNETEYNVVYELKGLYRTSMKERYESHRIALAAGFMNDDEVRAIEGMGARLDGLGGIYSKPVNTMPADVWVDYFKKESND